MVTALGRAAFDRIADWLAARSLERHRSHIGWRTAGRYKAYVKRCRREAPMPMTADPATASAIAAFERDGVTPLCWPGSTGAARLISCRIADLEAADTASWDEISESATARGTGTSGSIFRNSSPCSADPSATS